MFISIFILAVIISAFFDQQQRQHKLELQIEYEKLGRQMPEERPRLPMYESIANVVVGLILAEIGAVKLWAFIGVLRTASEIAVKSGFPIQIDFMSALLAGGVALVILGAKSVRVNLKYRRSLIRQA